MVHRLGLVLLVTALILPPTGQNALATPTPSVSASPSPVSPSPTSPMPPATQIVVPNGVGLNYQAAQDLWRAAGLHVAPAHDATGVHRLPIIDSNWVVLAQDPPAGTQVERGTFITATVKKYTDD
jgi:hypothetical protein